MAAGEDAVKLYEPKYPYRPIPPMEEIVERLSKEPPDAKYTEIVSTVYSNDKTGRFTIYKDREGMYRYIYEEIHVTSEELWNFQCRINKFAYPAAWSNVDMFWPDVSFATPEEAYESMIQVHKYKDYFE